MLYFAVAPHAGAWIEIFLTLLWCWSPPVAPHAGAWIEIDQPILVQNANIVAPHAGAWIEIPCLRGMPNREKRRPPRGGVD